MENKAGSESSKANGWASIAMDSCVVEPNESEAKYPTSVWRDFNLHLNEMDLRSQQ